MASHRKRFGQAVFINCPFDDEYEPIFEAITFAVIACGFDPRCAAEIVDADGIRRRSMRWVQPAEALGCSRSEG